MVLRVRSNGRWWGHGLGGGAGVQPNLVQYAPRHCNQRVADHFPKRHASNPQPRHSPMPHHPKQEGLSGSHRRRRVPPPSHRRPLRR